jgi:hypothetical protein
MTTADKIMYTIAAIALLVALVIVVWVGYIMFLEPPPQSPPPTKTPTPLPPTPTARPTSTPRPTPTPRPPTPTPKPTPTPTPSGLTRYDPIPMGDSVVADNKLRLTVLRVEHDAWPRIYEANMFNPEPGEGMEYIIVTIRVTNLAAPSDTRIVSEFHFRVTGERGIVYSQPFVVLERKELNAEFYGGVTIEGEMPFEVGQGEKNLVLIYDPGLGSTARYLSLENSQKRSAATATPIPSRPTQPTTEIPRVECEALITLYNSTDGANWSNNSGWLGTSTPCSWYGVTCQGGHVTQLDLHKNQLSGSIPPELGNLVYLERLHLRGNQQLSGNIPPELGNLVNLRELNLWGTNKSGNIPPELGNLTNLQYLLLYGGHLSGNIPPELGNLTNLQQLILSSNHLSGDIPPELGKLVNLRELHLHSNRLSGGVPSELGNLTNLWKLHIANNQLSGALPKSLMKLDKLSFFYYGGTKLCAPADAAFQTWLEGIKDLQTTGVICQ